MHCGSPLRSWERLRSLVSAPADTGSGKRRIRYVQSSHSHRIPRQRREVKTARKENSFTVLSLATKRSWKDRETGERQSQTTWHRCIVWGKLGGYAATLTKGAHVRIEGEIQSREYTQKGGGKKSPDIKKSITEIRVNSILKLDRAAASGNPAPEGGPSREVAE